MPIRTSVQLLGDDYVCRVETDDDFYHLDYDKLLATADPGNWHAAYPAFWHSPLTPLGTDAWGWSRMIEHVRWRDYAYDVPLRFWKGMLGPDIFFLNYEVDPTPVTDHPTSPEVRIDQGYLWVERKREGVHVATTKQEHIEGTSTVLASRLFGPWGYHEALTEFYDNLAALADSGDYLPFELSQEVS